MRVIVLGMLLWTRVAGAQAQDLGHRIPAARGLDAGTQAEEGIYLGDRFVWFSSEKLRDRNGDVIPVENLELDAYANVVGVAGTKRLRTVYLSAAVGVPIVKLSVSADRPEASLDRFGLADIFVEPIKLGRRGTRFDLVGSYSFYIPTRQAERSGLGSSQLAHELSLGGTLFFDDRRAWRLTAVGSYVHHRRKQDLDITRGDITLVQGGLGGVVRTIDLGVAGYALWQVTDDTGSDLPAALRGVRERGFGLGPELGIPLRALRGKLTARWTWDVDGRARPVGTIFLLGLSFAVLR